MKQVFKCDYCEFMGTEQEVEKHEVECVNNYSRRSCYTCRHRGYQGLCFTCSNGVELPAGKLCEFCKQYDQEEKSTNPLDDLVNLMFGGKLG